MVNTAAYRPRPGLSVIPAGFNEHHQPAVNGTHTATVEYWTGPAAGEPEVAWDHTTHTETRNYGTRIPDKPIPARVQRILSEDTTTAGGQTVTTRSYRVTTNHDAPEALTVDGFVKVLDGDPYLDGRWLSVSDVQGNSLTFERAIICLDNLG